MSTGMKTRQFETVEQFNREQVEPPRVIFDLRSEKEASIEIASATQKASIQDPVRR
jgi:hypothetical protein